MKKKMLALGLLTLLTITLVHEAKAGMFQAVCRKEVYQHTQTLEVVKGTGLGNLGMNWNYQHTEYFCGGFSLYCGIVGVEIITTP